MTTDFEIKVVEPEIVWQVRHEVMWPDKSLDFVKLPHDELGSHLGLYAEKELVSVVSLFVENNEMQFRKFATKSMYQGKGFGTNLLTHVFDLARKQLNTRVWCNARFEKKGFYEKFGMAASSMPFPKSGITYVTMEKHLQL